MLVGNTGCRCAKVPVLVGSLGLSKVQDAEPGRRFAGAYYNRSFEDRCDR